MLRINRYVYFYFIAMLLLISCSHYSPKPVAYLRLDDYKTQTAMFHSSLFSFELPVDAVVSQESKGDELWLTIRFPHYKANLYCTYLPINSQNLRLALDDSYRMAFSHAVKANAISQKLMENSAEHTGGVMYEISGNVATPRQFFLTDSVSHFFRASLYFDGKVNADSIAPLLKYMDNKIKNMVNTFRWKP